MKTKKDKDRNTVKNKVKKDNVVISLRIIKEMLYDIEEFPVDDLVEFTKELYEVEGTLIEIVDSINDKYQND